MGNVKKLYSLESQKEQNEILAKRINAFWAEKGMSANARVEQIQIELPQRMIKYCNLEPGRSVKSWEIVSGVSDWTEAW